MARTRSLDAGDEEFFDSRETISPPSVASPASSGRHSGAGDGDGVLLCGGALLEVWATGPFSVEERRERFVRSLGLLDPGESGPRPMPRASLEIVLASPAAAPASLAPRLARGAAGEGEEAGAPGRSGGGGGGEDGLECVFKNLDDGTVFVVHELGKDGSFRSLRERRSNRTVTAAEFERISGSSPFIREMMRRVDDSSDEPSTPEKSRRRRRRRFGWLRRLGVGACVVDAEDDDEANSTSSSSCRSCAGKPGKAVDRVKVRPYKKRSKELSAVYRGQDIRAHKGAIVAMKFSSDGQYLATGGEDGVVRVWRVVEGERPDELDFAEDDPSCVFFTVNENSELAPVNSSEGTKSKQDNKSSKGQADPACVVIPHRTFALSQVPVHEFYGHDDAILDLSWSKNGDLTSASMDKTARLWRVGCNSCLKVFYHNNYGDLRSVSSYE
ncbi:unnamed protein product [Triticum turgidum subsp. durum]|uniref:WD repeat-containing protein 44 n=1 Tax=Triticum turgidum subsp. durum TaxID=4567 RepID=A0A9R0TCD8_TRITD|nr:unnamed protein product [Triticum turgidum subsp. durum]